MLWYKKLLNRFYVYADLMVADYFDIKKIGISIDGPLISDYHAEFEGKDYGMVAYVLITGIKKYREEKTAKSESGIIVKPRNIETYREYHEIAPHISPMANTVFSFLDQQGFVVVTYKNGKYLGYVPEQDAGRELVRERFTNPPSRHIKKLESFELPIRSEGKKVFSPIKKPPENGDLQWICIACEEKYKFSIVNDIIKRGGKLKELDCLEASFALDKKTMDSLIYHDKIDRRRYADQSIKGIVNIMYSDNHFPAWAVGEAFEREGERENNAYGLNIPLSATPLEICPTKSMVKKQKPINLTNSERQKITDKIRSEMKEREAYSTI